MLKKFIYPIATISGTIVGVGFFSLPYITSKVGIWTMLAYLLFLGALVIVIHLIFGKLAIRTPDFKRLPGFAKFYLGKWGERLALITIIFGFLGSILAYLIVGGNFLANLLSPIFGGSSFFYTLLYFSAGAFLIFFGIKIICKIQFLALGILFFILITIFLKGLPFFRLENLFLNSEGLFPSLEHLFLPYGPILFALWGASIIPETEEMLGENKNLLKKIILIGILIPVVIYLFFIFMILGITGSNVSSDAISGLRSIFGNGIIYLAFLSGVLTTFIAFLSIGLTLKKTLWYDFKIPKNLAWGISCFVPFMLFLAGLKDFISVISLVGGVMLGIDGILILLMYRKIGGKIALVYPLVLVFVAGIVYEIIYFIK